MAGGAEGPLQPSYLLWLFYLKGSIFVLILKLILNGAMKRGQGTCSTYLSFQLMYHARPKVCSGMNLPPHILILLVLSKCKDLSKIISGLDVFLYCEVSLWSTCVTWLDKSVHIWMLIAKSILVVGKIWDCLYMLTLLHARTNVPLSSARLPTSFQQPHNKLAKIYPTLSTNIPNISNVWHLQHFNTFWKKWPLEKTEEKVVYPIQ